MGIVYLENRELKLACDIEDLPRGNSIIILGEGDEDTLEVATKAFEAGQNNPKVDR